MSSSNSEREVLTPPFQDTDIKSGYFHRSSYSASSPNVCSRVNGTLPSVLVDCETMERNLLARSNASLDVA